MAEETRSSEPAADELAALAYNELRMLARGLLRDAPRGFSLQPTAVVHEAYLRLVDQRKLGWNDRRHFVAIAAQIMRRVVLDHLRRRRTQKRGGLDVRVTLDDSLPMPGSADVLDVDAALGRLAELDPRRAEVVTYRVFGGLTVDEIAEVMGLSRSTVERSWRAARAWLSRELRDRGPAS